MTRRLVDMVRQWPGVVVAALMSTCYLVVLVPAQDYASGAFRAHLASSGAVLWNNMWFGGHPLPAYGMLSAQLAGVIGVRPLAALSTAVATWGFTLLARRTHHQRVGSVAVASVSFAVCAGINMWAGRLTFAPSIALGVLCLLALHKNKTWWSALAAFACALASPVGAVFLLVILGASWWSGWNRNRVALAAVAVVVPLMLSIVLFSEGGWFPFRWQSLLMVCIGTTMVVVSSGSSIVRRAALVYFVVVLAAFALRTPLGGNVVRLGWIAAAPLALLFIPCTRRLLTTAVFVFAVCWNGVYLPFDRPLDVASVRTEFYEPVSRFMQSLPGVHKVEVVPTNTRRESDVIAVRTPLARGWQTQIDRDRNALFYSGNLTAREYRKWLDQNAVSYVAVPTQHVHVAAREEAALANSMGDDLSAVYRDDAWTIYVVRSAVPLATNDVVITSVTPEQIRLTAVRAGRSVVRFRYTPMYSVTSGNACVSEDFDGWISLDVREPGDIVLTVSFSLSRFIRHGVECG